ncbi:MAG: hypothetical protein ACOZNI_27210 [Myxococcota bacterium]
MPTTVIFGGSASDTGVRMRVLVDADGDGALEDAEEYAMFPSGPKNAQRSVQLLADETSGTSFVLKLEGPVGATVDLEVANATGGTIYRNQLPVRIPKGGRTWLAGTLA